MTLAACAPVSTGNAGERVNILLAPRSEGLILYNRYQQRLTSTEAVAILPYEPMIIEDENAVLGDGFTRCVAIRLRGEVYFLLRSTDGGLPPGVAAYREAELLEDTLRILPGKEVVMESPDHATKRSLAGGMGLVRHFSYKGAWFVREAGGRGPLSGWIREETGDAAGWEVIRRSHTTRAGRSMVEVRSVVDEEVRGVNRMLHALFRQLESHAVDRDSVPHLMVETFRDSLRCRLVPGGLAPGYRGGMEALAETLVRRLGNRDLTCVVTPIGVIVKTVPGPHR